MVEIAIALAVIGFALVAIIGVLPAGMNVQKENREETIINQDATVFLEAIRNGARGLDDLTNYVKVITNYVWLEPIPTNSPAGAPDRVNWYTFETANINGVPTPSLRLANGARIIGLLSTPKYVPVGGGFEINQVIAHVRAMSGSAGEKFPQTNANILDLAFAYRLIPELLPVQMVETNDVYLKTFDANLHELRLAFRWPLLPNNLVGNGRHAFRTLAGGRFVKTNDLYFLQSSTFTMVP